MSPTKPTLIPSQHSVYMADKCKQSCGCTEGYGFPDPAVRLTACGGCDDHVHEQQTISAPTTNQHMGERYTQSCGCTTAHLATGTRRVLPPLVNTSWYGGAQRVLPAVVVMRRRPRRGLPPGVDAVCFFAFARAALRAAATSFATTRPDTAHAAMACVSSRWARASRNMLLLCTTSSRDCIATTEHDG